MALVHTQILGGRAGAHKGMVVVRIGIHNLLQAVDQNVFIADQTYRMVGATEVHAVASDAGTAHIVVIRQCIGTVAPVGGLRVVGGGFDLKAAANTVQDRSNQIAPADSPLPTGHRLALDFGVTGDAPTVLGGMVLTFLLLPMSVTGQGDGIVEGDTGDKRYWLSDV